MKHAMRLFPENFERVKTGQKQREYRLYDEKRRNVHIGDTIIFTNTQTQESVTVSVENVFVFHDFTTCYQAFWEEDFACRGQTLEQVVSNTYRNWWPKESEEKYGCVVFAIKLCKEAK